MQRPAQTKTAQKPPTPQPTKRNTPKTQKDGKKDEKKKKSTTKKILDVLGITFMVIMMFALLFWAYRIWTNMKSPARAETAESEAVAQPERSTRPIVSMTPSTVHAMRSLTEQFRKFEHGE